MIEEDVVNLRIAIGFGIVSHQKESLTGAVFWSIKLRKSSIPHFPLVHQLWCLLPKPYMLKLETGTYHNITRDYCIIFELSFLSIYRLFFVGYSYSKTEDVLFRFEPQAIYSPTAGFANINFRLAIPPRISRKLCIQSVSNPTININA